METFLGWFSLGIDPKKIDFFIFCNFWNFEMFEILKFWNFEILIFFENIIIPGEDPNSQEFQTSNEKQKTSKQKQKTKQNIPLSKMRLESGT